MSMVIRDNRLRRSELVHMAGFRHWRKVLALHPLKQ